MPEEDQVVERSSNRDESNLFPGTMHPTSNPTVPRMVPSKRPATLNAEPSKRIKVDSPAASNPADERGSTPRGVARVLNKGIYRSFFHAPLLDLDCLQPPPVCT